MQYCRDCGEEIEFRYMNGQPTPIHINGGFCAGWSEGTAKSNVSTGATRIRSLKSYINPNAICPVCRKFVFFYQSPTGGRVFFDDLGWPWPKHPCTDNPTSQKGIVTSSGSQIARFLFKNKNGDALIVYELDRLGEVSNRIHATFRRMGTNIVFRASIGAGILEKNVNKQDFWEAPSFVMKGDNDLNDYRLVEFISARKKKIVRIKMRIERK
jgi:hypothetical protein